jgi:glycosyltransferase involved in cell wall biosynthesis
VSAVGATANSSETAPSRSILFVLPWKLDSTGGVSIAVKNLIDQTYFHKEFRPLLLVPNWATRHLKETNQTTYDLLEMRIVPLAPSNGFLRFFFNLLFRAVPTTFRLLLLVRKYSVACIHIHYPTQHAFFFALVKRVFRLRVPFFVSLHGADLSKIEASTGLKRQLYQFTVSTADCVVCCSQALARQSQRSLDLRPEKLVTIYNGIHPTLLESEINRSEPLSPLISHPYIVNVAKFEDKKGQDSLLRAFRLVADHGYQGQLLLVGAYTPYISHLRAETSRLQIQDRVRFLQDAPHHTALRAIRDADVFVLSSRREPFGIVLLEAGYLRTPIVATDVGGVREVVGGNGALLVAPDEPAAMAEAILQALHKPVETQIRTRYMYERVTEFTWTSAYLRYRDLCRSVC